MLICCLKKTQKLMRLSHNLKLNSDSKLYYTTLYERQSVKI
jgi:hypothetical protein